MPDDTPNHNDQSRPDSDQLAVNSSLRTEAASTSETSETSQPTPPTVDPQTLNTSTQVSAQNPDPVQVVKSSPGVLVLQWLTYAFWGWTVLALSWLTAVSVSFFVNKDSFGSSDNSAVAYSLAAVVVLFVISLLCDMFYSKREPIHKHGAASVIMIIHAVIFALFGIGSLIISVFAVVRMLIGDNLDSYSSGGDSSLPMLITGLIIAVVYGATLLRTLRPFKLKRSSLIYWLFMAVVTVVVTVLAIAGPSLYARETKTDRLIESSLSDVSEAVRSYTTKNGALPQSLDQVKDFASPGADKLIEQDLVDYKPGLKISEMDLNNSLSPLNGKANYRYTLCVDYKAKRNSGSVRPTYDDVYLSTYSHAAGRVCYNLKTGSGYDSKY